MSLISSYLCHIAGIGIDDFCSDKQSGKVFILWEFFSSVIAIAKNKDKIYQKVFLVVSVHDEDVSVVMDVKKLMKKWINDFS